MPNSLRDSKSKKAMNAVVRLHIRGFSESNLNSILDPRFAMPEEWIGSGFFIRIGKEEGYILTNSHVARNASTIEARSILTSDEPFRVNIVGLVENLEPDLALLKLAKGEVERFKQISSEKRIPFLSFADSTKIFRGEIIKAIGYPLGMEEPNISSGVVSNFIAGSHDIVERIVTDAAINPGNSGGPAVTKSGLVLGINTAVAVGAANIGYITPIHIVQNVLPQILKKKKTPGVCVLGVETQKNSNSNAHFLGQKDPDGLIITKVLKDSLAARLKLRPRDVLIGINKHRFDRHGNVIGERISRKRNFFDVLHSLPIQSPVTFYIWRNRREMKINSKALSLLVQEIQTQPILRKRRYICFQGLVVQEVCAEILNAFQTQYGVEPTILYRDFSLSKSRILVTHVNQASLAEELGVEIGEFVTQVNDTMVKSLDDFESALLRSYNKSKKVILLTMSSGAFGAFHFQNLRRNDLRINYFGGVSEKQNL